MSRFLTSLFRCRVACDTLATASDLHGIWALTSASCLPAAPPPTAPGRSIGQGTGRRRATWLWLPLLGLIPLIGAVLASELPFFNGGSSGSPEAAQSAATAPPSRRDRGHRRGEADPAGHPSSAAGHSPGQRRSARATASRPVARRRANRCDRLPLAADRNVVAAAVPTNAAPQANAPFIAYRVQPGDTVKSIATTYGVTPSTISNASGLANPDRLQVGQVLTVPAQPGYLYRVQPGRNARPDRRAHGHRPRHHRHRQPPVDRQRPRGRRPAHPRPGSARSK